TTVSDPAYGGPWSQLGCSASSVIAVITREPTLRHHHLQCVLPCATFDSRGHCNETAQTFAGSGLPTLRQERRGLRRHRLRRRIDRPVFASRMRTSAGVGSRAPTGGSPTAQSDRHERYRQSTHED